MASTKRRRRWFAAKQKSGHASHASISEATFADQVVATLEDEWVQLIASAYLANGRGMRRGASHADAPTGKESSGYRSLRIDRLDRFSCMKDSRPRFLMVMVRRW